MSSEWILLSHLLHPDAPAYGGHQAFFDEPDKEMVKGDSCNTRQWKMSNHAGTHIDAPRHFSIDGKTIDRYPPNFWIFSRPFVLMVNGVEPGQILNDEDMDLASIPSDTNFLIIKTGFGVFRDSPIYWQKNPGLHPDLAEEFRHLFPDLRVVGFDFISVSSFADRELGRRAHKAFLDHTRPLLLLEDMDLSVNYDEKRVNQVVVSPLHVKGADAAPCTVLAEVTR